MAVCYRGNEINGNVFVDKSISEMRVPSELRREKQVLSFLLRSTRVFFIV